jgi:MFS family permease
MNASTKITLTSGFFLNFAGFAVFSFLAVYLSNSIGLTPWETGTVLSLLTLSSRALPLFTGIMGDQLGYKRMMGIGLFLRGIGFVVLAYAPSFLEVSVAILLIGIGAACYEPAALAFFSQEENPSVRKKSFIYLNLALNGGAIAGPLLGGFLVITDPSLPFLLSASIFFVLFIVQSIYLPKHTKARGSGKGAIFSGIRHILNNKRFLFFCFSMVFFWFMYAQLTVALPLHMFALSNKEHLVSLVITVNALSGLIFMAAFNRIYMKTSALFLSSIGTLIMALSFLCIGFFPNPIWLIVCIVGFTVGETLVLPSADISVSDFADESYSGAYYGFSDLSFAVGATLGNFSGAFLLNAYKPESMIPWVTFACVGLFGVILLGGLYQLQKRTVPALK